MYGMYIYIYTYDVSPKQTPMGNTSDHVRIVGSCDQISTVAEPWDKQPPHSLLGDSLKHRRYRNTFYIW